MLFLLAATARPTAAQEPDSIAARRLTDSVWVVEGAVDNIGVLTGPEGTLLVDAGYAETESGVRAALARIEAAAPRILINTHWHHAFANAGFAGQAVIIGHASLADRLSRPNVMYTRDLPAFPEAALPDVSFSDSLQLAFGAEDILLLHYAHAHTESDVVVFMRRANIVFTGDLFVPHVPWVDVESGGDARGWLAAIDDLVARVPEDAILVPGHDDISDVATLREFRALLAEAIDAVEDGIRAGRTAEEIAVAGLSDRWDSWEGVIPIGMFLETIHQSVARDIQGPASTCDTGDMPARLEFTGGLWWDGTRFAPDTFYSVDGWLSRQRPGGTIRQVDLGGGYVIPPLADAHTHRLAHADEIVADVDDHRRHGVLYAMNMDPMRIVDGSLLSRVGGPCGVDVAYTEGVIAPSWSVIPDFYRMMAEGGRFGVDVTLEDLAGEVIHLIDDADDLEAAWHRLASRNPAFLKVVLAFSDELAKRRGNGRYPAAFPLGSGKPGLDPALLPDIVRRAHRAGIRVAAHVETAADFRTAVRSGVDLIAHLPGSWQVGETAGYADGDLAPWLLTEQDARAAAGSGVVVVTTAAGDPADPRRAAFARIHHHNIPLLRAAGVRIALGSDGAPGSTVTEALHLAALGVLEGRDLLDAATREPARAIFPGRRIGALEAGYEASFVVLDGDPLADPAYLGHVRLIVKDGVSQVIPDR